MLNIVSEQRLLLHVLGLDYVHILGLIPKKLQSQVVVMHQSASEWKVARTLEQQIGRG